MRTIHRTAPELIVGAPCRPVYQHHELRTDGSRFVGVRVIEGQGDAQFYNPSPIWLGQVARLLGGGEIGLSLVPASPRDIDFLLGLE